MKPSLSIAIITFNEAANLGRCLESAKFADQIIIVDQGSTDETIKIAEEHGATIVHQDWLGFGAQKNVALSHCTSDWILSLDADEVITPALQIEIKATLADPQAQGYYLPRLAYIGTAAIHHSGWYPDYTLRLVRRDMAKFEDKKVHERMITPEKTAQLHQPLDHFTYRDINHWFTKLNRYTTEEAVTRPDFSLARLLLKPPLAFLRTYFLWQGFRDGIWGFTIANSNALYAFLSEMKRFEQSKIKK